MKRHSMSTKHRELLEKDLETIMQRLSDITILLNVFYRGKSEIPARVDEAHAALDRLLLALEREGGVLAFRSHRLRLGGVTGTLANDRNVTSAA